MQFRVRPSSKKSSHHEVSLVEFPTSKSLQGPDSPLPRSMASRIDQLEGSLSAFQEMYRRDRQISNVSFVESQKRLDKVQYKMFSAEQELRQLGELRELKQPREIVQHHQGNEPSKNEIMFLKQTILQEKDSQRELAKHQNSQIQQLSLKILRQEQEMREIIGQQRIQWEQRLSGQEEEIREVQGLKNRKIEQQYEMIKSVIASAERKIYEQLQRKIRNETVIKDFVEERIAQLKEELGSEHRQTLASEMKFIKETKQSLQNLFAITNNIKRELSQELAQTQKLTTGSIKRLSMALDISREKSVGELKLATQLHTETANELVELRHFVTARLEENRQIMSQFESQTLDRVDNGGTSSRVGPQVDHQRLSLLQKEINQWKTLTEQKNLNVFKEISNTLKAMKLQWRKQNDEFVSEVAALNQSLKAQKKSAPLQLKKSVQTLVSIFNNEFDVLAEELETLTDMIALAKKENEKSFKEDLSRLKTQIQEEIKNAVTQRGKQCNLYTDKIVGRSEENMKAYISKEVKFSTDTLSQRIQKNQTTLSQLGTTMKKMSLLTSSQLEDYSVKLKGFNDNYKEYLEEQRKEDLKKRIDLEDTMRKNAQNLMDVYYKKSQFLVEGLKNNLEVAQMKQKVEAAQALQTAKDELKKEVQVARQEWQKELSQGVQKITKERETSEEMLHEAIGQEINNAKRALTNEIGNSKLQLDEKITELKKKEEQRQAEQEQKQLQFKNTVLGMLRDQKKLTQQKIQTNKQEVETKISGMETKMATLEQTAKEKETAVERKMAALEQTAKDKETADQNRQSANKKQMQSHIASEISKLETVQKGQLKEVKASLEQSIALHKDETSLKLSKLQEDGKKSEGEKVKLQQDSKSRADELQVKIDSNRQALEAEIKGISAKLQETNKTKQTIQQLQARMTSNKTNIESNIKEIQTKLEDLSKKMGENKVEAENEKSASQKQIETKQELEQKITVLAKDFQTKNAANSQKIEEVKKKINEMQISSEKKEGEGKQVGESSLNKVKNDLEKEIQSLSARVQELQTHDKGQQNEEAITGIRKSVNKLEAMVFSEQAKNKAMFDRLTEDMNKVTQNVQLLTNQMQ